MSTVILYNRAMQKLSRSQRIALNILCIIGLWALIVPAPAAAQSSTSLPDAHLGYGIHVGPYSSADPDLVDQLGMDWVKLYTEGQIGTYSHKRILYRMDIGWPGDGNWDTVRSQIRERAARLAAAGVDAVEIHNEPNLAMEWPHGPNAWEYTVLLRVAYTEVKAVAPQLIVVSGGLAPTVTTADRRAISDIEFAAEMLDNGAAQWFDAFGYHPYGYNQPPEVEPSTDTLTFRRVELIRALFEERGIYDKQIWLTEFGWLRDPAEENVHCSDSDPNFAGFAWMRVSSQTQADYTVRAFDWADRNWEWAGPMFLWNLNWSLYTPNVSPMCSHMRWFGVLDTKGNPLPVFQRVAAMTHRYSDYLPHLTIYAENMSAETSIYCPGSILVGEFEIVNSGYPGSFTATVDVAVPPGGPPVEVYPDQLRSGDLVQVYADTTDLAPGLHVIYLNVRTTIGGRAVAEVIQGYIVVTDLQSECSP
ncbi:MAG: hypothetical protein JXA10_20040 [Anaerolineae bacterium]|nr:hypothetical protein [Anaerolineae bacterium]